jgi:hypothetical protein
MLVTIEDFYTVGNGIINSFEFPDLSESKLSGLTVFRVLNAGDSQIEEKGAWRSDFRMEE